MQEDLTTTPGQYFKLMELRDEPGMGCRMASGTGGGEGKREKPSILKYCSDSFTLLLDLELAPYPILMQMEFQQLRAGSKRQGSRMCV